MTLRLRVISAQRRQLGALDTAEFGASGGTIGRSTDNDWTLPDARCFVSARHARIFCRDGQYYIEDISTNGVYVNDAAEPLARQARDAYRLRDGDVLRIGEYQIGVSLEQPNSTDSAAVIPSRIVAVRPLAAPQADIAPFTLEDLLGSEPAGTGEPRAGDAFRQERAAAPARAAAEPATKTRPRPAPESGSDTVARRLTRMTRATGRDEAGAAQEATAWQAFCRGAGLKPEQLALHAQDLMHLAGRLLRETLVGLSDLERSRAQIRERFRIEPGQSETEGPTLGQLTVGELLPELFNQHEAHAVDAVRWLRERHDEIKAHDQALAQAFRVAFIEFLGRLDPAELEARFERGQRGQADPTQYWAQFTSFYRNLLARPADQLPPTFIEAFTAAYQDSLRPQTLDMPRSDRPKPARSG